MIAPGTGGPYATVGDPREAAEFLRALWPEGLPAGAGVVLCRNVADAGVWIADLEQARRRVMIGEYRFIRCTASRQPVGGRGGAELAVALPGLHLDFDVREGSHRAANLPSLSEAMAFIESLPCRPTLILYTGGGLHLWWLFKEPWSLEDPVERQRAQRLNEGWQGFIQEQAKAKDWHVDGTASLAQLMRIAGTLNSKYDPPRLVAQIAGTGLRWNPSDFEQWQAGYHAGGPAARGDETAQGVEHLPLEVPKRLLDVLHRAGLPFRIKRDDTGGIAALLLDTCPACGGRERRGTVVKESAHVAPLLGALRCKRETCEARQSHGGIPLWTWVSRWAPDALPFVAADVGLFPPDVRRVSLTDAPRELRRLLDDAVEWVGETQGIGLVVTPPGVGKSRAVLELMQRRPRTAFFGRNYRELDERMREFGSTSQLREGISRACSEPGVAAAKQNHVLRGWRGTACKGCLQRDACSVWKPIDPNIALFAPHDADEALASDDDDAAGLRLREDPLGDRAACEGRLVVYDECPPVLRLHRLTAAELARVETAPTGDTSGEAAAERREQVEVAIMLARGLLDALRFLAEEAEEMSEDSSSRARYVSYEQEQIARLLDRSGASVPLTLPVLRRGVELPDNLFAVPMAHERREGSWALDDGEPEFAHDDTLPILRAWAAVLLNPPPLLRPLERSLGRLRISLDAAGRAVVELRTPRPLFPPHGALILDATGYLDMDALRSSNPHRPVRVFGLDVEPAPDAETHRLWIMTTSASRRTILKGGIFTARGARLLERCLRLVDRRACEIFGHPAKLGLISYMPVRKALETAIEGKKDTVVALETCSRMLVFDRGRLGHYGRDERGSNAFKDVDVLITWGDPRPNVGAAEADGRALGFPRPQVRVDAMTHASLAQAVGRARAIRGGRQLLVHVGSVCPPTWRGSCEVEFLDRGRPAKGEREDYLENVRHLVATTGWASAWSVDAHIALSKAPEGVGQNVSLIKRKGHSDRPPSEPSQRAGAAPGTARTRRRWVEEGGRTFGAVQVRVPLPCRVVWARPEMDPAEVRRLAAHRWAELNPPEPEGSDATARLTKLLGHRAGQPGAGVVQQVVADAVDRLEEREAIYEADAGLTPAEAQERALGEAERRLRQMLEVCGLHLAFLAVADPGQQYLTALVAAGTTGRAENEEVRRSA